MSPMKPRPNPPVSSVPDLSARPGCQALDAKSLMACVSADALHDDVGRLAEPRPPGSVGHTKVRTLCEQRLLALDYEPTSVRYGTGINVIGTKPGFSKPEEVVVIGAHYDAVAGCPGANDNASGVAAVLEAARVLSTARFDRTLVVACWDEGENDQAGSIAHAAQAEGEEVQVKLAVSFQAVFFASHAVDSQRVPEGFERAFPDQSLALLDNDNRADFLTVIAESSTETWADRMVEHARHVDLSVHRLTLTERMKVKQRDFHRSDHVSFWERGFPAMLVTDTGPFRSDRVGCKSGSDDKNVLDYAFARKVTQASVGAIVSALQLR